MPTLVSTKVDLIEELMYRCWARRNYLPPELREADWHPIILEEMFRRDQELSDQDRQEVLINQTSNKAYVPLLPNVTHYVHPGHTEIKEPHFLTAAANSSNLQTDSIYAGGIYEFGV